MAWRSLLRNKVSSVINIGGLMVGLAVGIIILLYVMDRLGYDRFNKNHAAIHQVLFNHPVSGDIATEWITPIPLGPAIRTEMPALKYVVRTRENTWLVRYGDKSLYQAGLYAESDYFHMMTFPALEGDPVAALMKTGSVVLTQSAAQRLFGKEDALGKTIMLDDADPMEVGAVIRDVPTNSSTQFDLVLPFSRYEKGSPAKVTWGSSSVHTWIQLQPGASLAAVNRQMNAILHEHSDNSDIRKMELFAYPLDRHVLYDSFRNGKPAGGKIYLVIIMAVLAALVLLVACVNFMNLSTAMAERRAREVGLRKVLGASRLVIMGQFLGEALLLALIALALSIPLAYIILPGFMAFTGQQLAHEFGDARLWVMLLILGLCTGLVSGSYPALYLSRFQPIKVLKRMVSLGWSGASFRKGLVTFQFAIAIFLIIGVVVCFKQINYMVNRPIGYEPSNLVDITADGDLPASFDAFKTRMQAIPGVLGITAGSDNLLHFWARKNNLDWPGKNPGQDIIFHVTNVEYGWARTAGIKIMEGRDFSPAFGSDTTACLVNQAAVRSMGLEGEAPGIQLGGHTIVGVVEDFVYNNPTGTPQPLIIYLNKNGLGHILMRLANDGQWRDRLADIQKVARELNPRYPFAFRFIKDDYQAEFVNLYATRQLVGIFGGVAIFIACLGLFGFAGFIVERRKKEISIRKVLGATRAALWLSLSREFLKPVVLGFVIAVPLGILAMQKLLATVDYHIQLSWWIFALAGAIVLLIAFAIVSYHGFRAARLNPAKSLQVE